MTDGFVLKRVGKCSESTNGLVSLEAIVTRIGRHTINDCCMDSAELPCLVSRFHSAIMREVADGIVKYSIYDCKSLNGTFVNNIKIAAEKNFVLKEGDILTFGCRGGDAVKEGGKATEEYSEFQYMFTRKSAVNDINNSNGVAHKANHRTSPKGRANGIEKSFVEPHLSSSLDSEASSNQHVKDHVTSNAGMQRSSKVQTLPVKNALNNSTGHLTMPSEQRTPVAGSRKRKVASNSTTKSTMSASFFENGGVAKQQKISDSKDHSKVKMQKTKRNTRKNLTYSDDELCSAFDCKRPNSETVSWVQCDDCDEWFHIDCVRTIQGSYNIEQLEEAEFHCGCV